MIGVDEGREGCFLTMRVQEILIPSGEEKGRWIGGVLMKRIRERRRGGKEGRRVDEEERGRGGKNERRIGGAVFLAMQVLKIPAGGRGFPLVSIIYTDIITTLHYCECNIYRNTTIIKSKNCKKNKSGLKDSGQNLAGQL